MPRPHPAVLAKHVLVDGEPISGSLFDFGLYPFTTRRSCSRATTCPLTSICRKWRGHLEARIWNDAFKLAHQDELQLFRRGRSEPQSPNKTIPAAFEMDEILYELRESIRLTQLRTLGLHFFLHQAVSQ